MAELQMETRVIGGIPAVDLRGDLDSYSAPRVRDLLETLLSDEAKSVLVNLTALDYLDSTGLGVLVAGLKQATDNQGTLVLIGPPPPVARVLHVTGLHKVFPVFDDEAAAQDFLRAQAS